MKLFRIPIIFLILFLPSIALTQALKTTIADILANLDKYDGKMVQVEGKVVSPQFKTSKKGNPYTFFKVKDESGNTLSVFSFGKLPIKTDNTVKVSGRYQKVKHVPHRYTFYNEIDASQGNVERIK